MKTILAILSWVSLLLLVAAPILFYVGRVSLETNKVLMLLATIIWFASAPGWMGRDTVGDSHRRKDG